MPLAFAVVCEAAADFRTATGLAGRIICDHVHWVDEDSLASCPLWRGLDETRPFLLWAEVKNLAREVGIRPHGHFGDDPAEPDVHAARRALRFLKWKYASRPLDGILLIRDDDRDGRRRIGLEQARDAEHDLKGQVVIGLAHCKRECWVLAGFDPVDDGENDLLASTRGELGFDPRAEVHQLTAKHDADKRSAKRVLGLLTRDDADREARCWERAPMDTLLERGRETGLARFLEEVLSLLIPLFTGHS